MALSLAHLFSNDYLFIDKFKVHFEQSMHIVFLNSVEFKREEKHLCKIQFHKKNVQHCKSVQADYNVRHSSILFHSRNYALK